MKKVTIIYVSIHHQNTANLIADIKSMINAEVECINLLDDKKFELPISDLLILASGIYFNDMHKLILKYIDENSFKGRMVAILCTCGSRYRNHAKSVKKRLISKGAKYLGETYSRGFDTFGILKKIGGISKGHPNQEDVDRVAREINKIIDNI